VEPSECTHIDIMLLTNRVVPGFNDKIIHHLAGFDDNIIRHLVGVTINDDVLKAVVLQLYGTDIVRKFVVVICEYDPRPLLVGKSKLNNILTFLPIHVTTHERNIPFKHKVINYEFIRTGSYSDVCSYILHRW